MRARLLLLAAALACGGSSNGDDVAPVHVAQSSSGDESATASEPISPTRLRPPPDVEVPDDIVRFRVPVGRQPTLGPVDAPVTIVTFSDFQCPFCSRAQPTLARIVEQYGDQVRIVWRNNPLAFHQNADPAAQLAMEAYEQGGDERFWPVHDLLFANQRRLDRADLEAYAQQAQLDLDQVQRALGTREHARVIEADQQLAQQLGARGTPGFFINGRQLMGAQPYERFSEIIDQELVVVARLVEDGAPLATVYDALIADGRTEPAAPSPAAARPPRRQLDPAAVYRVPVDSRMPQRGPDDALVTIVTFSDFQCPFCSRVKPTIEQVLQHYGNDVRYVFLNNPLPFHQEAMPAAELALEAYAQQGDNGFWRVHDVLFENQRRLTPRDLERYAQQAGLDVGEVRQALTDHRHRQTITDQQQLARDLGATGTPAFFINGRNLRGAQPFPAFQALIDEELTKARRLVSQGTGRADVYAATIANGATSPQYLAAGAAPAAPPTPSPNADTVYTIAVPQRAPRRGARRRAPVVIQEFTDFQCPFCNRVRPTIDQLLQEYGDRVQLVFRDYPLPFHHHAHLAAEAAREVFRQRGDRAFWRYHDILFDNQQALEVDDLVRYGGEVRGINTRRLRRALENRTHQQAVDDDIEAVRDAGARIGTPSFFINGRLLQGAQPIASFRAAVDRALREAGQTPPTPPPTPTTGLQADVRLAPGFMPDPHVVQGSAGGARDASTLDPSCAGWVGAQPNHIFEATGSFPDLRVMAHSPADTTLVIQAPDGSYLCNDDAEGLNPMIAQGFGAGFYRIYVGTYDRGGSSSYRLGFSELSSVTPASLAP